MQFRKTKLTLWTLALLAGFQGISGLCLVRPPIEEEGDATKTESPVYRFFHPKKARPAVDAESAQRSKIFSQFRPVQKHDSIPDLRLESKSTIEQIYGHDFVKNMRSKYDGTVTPLEAKINNPNHFSNTREVGQYEQSRKDMVRWTTKEVLDDQLRNFFSHADKDSGEMRVVNAVKSVTSANFDDKEEVKPLTPEEKIAQAYRLDLPKKQEDEVTPTKLKTRFNVIQQRGQVNFQNPIATTNLNVDMKADDTVSFETKRDFKELKLSSKARYGMVKKVLTFNVNKVITDRISLDLTSDQYTGDAGPSGEKSNDSARLNYSLSF